MAGAVPRTAAFREQCQCVGKAFNFGIGSAPGRRAGR